MCRIRSKSAVHPETGVVIYRNGTCDAPVSYSRSGYKIYIVRDTYRRQPRVKSFLLHRHIADLFVPNPENKPFVNHKDGKKYNAAASNLEWATASENCLHAHATGLNKRKLTPQMVREIRKSKVPGYRLCYKYDVSEQTIYNVRNRITWKNVN